MARFSIPVALTLALALLLSAFGGVAFAQATTLDVELGDFYIDMQATIPSGPVTLEVTSVGAMPHTITIEGNGVSMTLPQTLSTGDSATWEIDLEPGTYTFYCPIGNHREAGMELTVTVEAAQVDPTPVPADPTATPAEADPTATVAGDEYSAPGATATREADSTAVPGAPATGVGGGSSDGLSTGMLSMLALIVLAAAAGGGGLLYHRQRQAG